jgi:low affinity Fe/Cu permease
LDKAAMNPSCRTDEPGKDAVDRSFRRTRAAGFGSGTFRFHPRLPMATTNTFVGRGEMKAAGKDQHDKLDRESDGPGKLFSDIANQTSQAAGRALTFMIAAGVVIVWAITGPIFHYSDTWQLVINTGTTVVTFLMVFLIQNSQNRDSSAIQVKLDELIRVSAAQNSFVGIEHLTDDELDEIRAKCERRAEAEKAGENIVKSARKKDGLPIS